MFNRDVVFPILMIVLSAVVLVMIPQFSKPLYQQDASVGADFFPTVLAIIQILLCIALLIQKKLTNSSSSENGRLFTKTAVFGIAFLIGYAVLISLLGYLVASLVAFTSYLLYLKSKKLSYYLTAWVFVFCIYYLFGHVFVISLPEGLLMGGFYD